MMICEADAFEQIADHDGTVFLASALKYTCHKKARITSQRMVPVPVYDMAVHKYRYIPRVVWYQVPGSLCRNKYIPYAVYVNGRKISVYIFNIYISTSVTKISSVIINLSGEET